MGVFKKAKIYSEAYFAERSGIPLPELLKAKARALVKHAPKGEPPYYISVQPDGSLLRAELHEENKDMLDELALRAEMGDKYADTLQRKAQGVIARISTCELDIRATSEAIEDEKDRRNLQVKNTYELGLKRTEAFSSFAVFVILALGEIGAVFTLFADFFGIDPTRLSKAFLKEPAAFLVALLPSFGIFIASLLIAEMVLAGKKRNAWIITLAVLAIAIGWMRGKQIFALQDEVAIGALLMPFLFSFTAFSFPLAAAFFINKWRAASIAIAKDSAKIRGVDAQERTYEEKLRKNVQHLANSEREFDRLIDEYVRHYQKDQRDKEMQKAEWEKYARYTENYLAELHIAYRFWSGWRRSKINQGQSPGSKYLPAVLAFISLVGIAQPAQASEDFNLIAICDRSSSAGEYACSKGNLEKAGRLWVEQAGDTEGGSFELVIIDTGFDSAEIAFYERYPARFPGPVTLNKRRWVDQFMDKLDKKAGGLPKNKGSAIAEALYRASLRIPQGGTTRIYILSDMRQVDGIFNFEKRVPGKAEFMRWLESKLIKPKFPPGTRLTVCGLHPYTLGNTSRMTTENYERVVDLWTEVFSKWGIKAEISEVCSFN
ncbi:MAG: hypothetical protein QY316_12900 [Thermodesulfobacteriota bacterium]|nr:MAG: hypothetical protein QY316_12900 [Thermodesulfobacteriota bacterium]